MTLEERHLAAQAVAGLQDGFRVGRGRVHNINRDHRNVQPVPPDGCHQRRKVLLHALGFDVSALAHRDIDSVEAGIRGRLGEFLSRDELQVLRENGYFQPCFGAR